MKNSHKRLYNWIYVSGEEVDYGFRTRDEKYRLRGKV